MNNKEIEIKIEIDENKYNTLLNDLTKRCNEKKCTIQEDTYYSPKTENYYDNGDRCLRLRETNNKSILSYKQIYENKDKRIIDEYETEIENSKMLKYIFQSIGIREDIKVKKKRIEFRLKYCIIALDDVENLGYFVEIENINPKNSIEKSNQEIKELAINLNLDLNKQNYEGYSNMMYRLRGK